MLENTEDILNPRKETDVMIHFIYTLLYNLWQYNICWQKFSKIWNSTCRNLFGYRWHAYKEF